jgi:hypothetical protein
MATKLSLEEALRRLESGEQIDTVMRSIAPPDEQEALKRCAVARIVDRAVAEEVLLPSSRVSVLGFDALLEKGLLETIPNSMQYRLKPDVRTDAFRAWWPGDRTAGFQTGSIPDELRDLSARLAVYYAKKDRPVDRFYHLVLVDPDAAANLFDALYSSADEVFDLAGCQELVNALADPDRSPLLSPRLAELFDERRVYLRARGDSSIDFYRTASFLEPTGMREQFDSLMKGKPARVLELHAGGGMGKTMRLRWLQARYCIPKRIPCVRIDFDVIDPINASRHPWLVMLELAALLNNQVPGSPFDLEPVYGVYRTLLRPGPHGDAKAASLILNDPAQREQARIEVTNRFSDTLADSVKGPVIVVLDTLEELVTRPAADMEGFVAAFQELHARTENLRLVFSGRNDLTERLPQFTAGFGKAKSFNVDAFSEEEARRYLRDVRGIDRRDVVDVIVDKADGVPFKLALFADTVIARPDLAADALDEYVDADLVWLIERVLARIPEKPIRWLVRYGFVPRRLTLEFAREVMMPHLGEGMPRPTRFDNPALDDLPEAAKQQRLFEHTDEKPDIDALWAGLRRYASQSSWVTEEPGDALVFHPNVREPMRDVMRKHRTAYRVLQRDAITYFEKRAKAEPNLWAMWMREAVYHAFMLSGPRGGKYWERLMNRAAIEGREEAREMLASTVLDPELFDDPTMAPVRRGKDKTKVVSVGTLIRANFEVAEAAARRATANGVGSDHPDWTVAQKRFDVAIRLQGDRRVIPAARLALVRAALLTSQGKLPEAETVLTTTRSRVRAGPDRAELDLALAELWASSEFEGRVGGLFGSPGIIASMVLRAAKYIRPRIVPVYRKMAEASLRNDRFEEAARICDQGLKEATTVAPDEVLPLRLLRAEIVARTGEPNRAMDELQSVDFTATPIELVRHATSIARSAVAAWRPSEALNWLDRAPQRLTLGDGPGASRALAEALEIRALAMAALLRSASEVAAAFEGAASSMTVAGHVEGSLRCHIASAKHSLREVGDLRHAKSVLERAELLAPKEVSEEWVRLRLRWAEYHDRRGDGTEARRIVDATLHGLLAQERAPHLVAAAALEGLALMSDPAPEEYAPVLGESLSRVKPPRARAVMLQRLDRVPAVKHIVPASQVHALRRLVPHVDLDSARPQRMEREDVLLAALADLEIGRICEPDRVPVAALVRLLDKIRQSDAPLLARRWLQLALEYGSDELRPAHEHAVAILGRAMPDESGLLGAVLVSVAESRLSESGAIGAAADELLAVAERELTTTSPSQWVARLHAARGVRARTAGEMLQSERRFRTARAIYEGLGEIRLIAEIDAALEHGSFATRDVESEVTILLESGADSLTLTGRAGGRHAVHRWSHADGPPVLASLTPDGPSGDLVSNVFLRRLAVDVRAVGEELGDLLGLGALLEQAAPSGHATDFRIETTQRELFAIPWELARVRGTDVPFPALAQVGEVYRSVPAAERATSEEIRFLQSSLARLMGVALQEDGFFGPKTKAVLREFQRSIGLPPDGRYTGQTKGALKVAVQHEGLQGAPVVVVARASRDRQVQYQRGALGREGVDVAEIYAQLGCEVHVVENAGAGSLAEKLSSLMARNRPPSICHLSGSISDVHGTLLLDLGSESYSSAETVPLYGAVMTARELDSVLRVIPDSATLNPVVILDAAAPRGPSETARHLVKRNGFAGELFVAGSTPAVVAMGLTSGASASALFGLLDPLMRGATFGDACRVARSARSSRVETDNELAIPSIALFAHSPSIGVVAPIPAP